MSQILVDEHLSRTEVLVPLQGWISAQKIEDLVPNETLKDDRILKILQSQRQPTFVTLDADFYHKKYRDRRSCLIHIVLPHQEQYRLPAFLRKLFRVPEFKTKAARMGKVMRVSEGRIDIWQVGNEKRPTMIWTASQ